METARFPYAMPHHNQQVPQRCKSPLVLGPGVAYNMLNAVTIKKIVNHLAVAVNNPETMPLILHYPDEVPEIVHVGRMVYVYENLHLLLNQFFLVYPK